MLIRNLYALGAAFVLTACQDTAPFALNSSQLKRSPVQYLSQSGLYADPSQLTIDPNNRPFAPAYELWSDGGVKERWLFLPPDTQIDTSNMDYWSFPVGTIVWKEFSFLGRRVETRMLEKMDPGNGPAAWSVSTFMWNAEQTDARRVNHGAADTAATPFDTMHDIPSVEQCTECHDHGGDMLLGISAIQLASPGPGLRLADLIREGKLSSAPIREPSIPGEGDSKQLYGELHANCAHCHNPRSPNRATVAQLFFHVPAAIESETELPLITTAVGSLTHFYTVPGRTLGVNSFDIERGSPESSAVFLRIQTRGNSEEQMPPLATEAVDAGLVNRLEEWIRVFR